MAKGPKMKNSSSASKRFSRTGTGRIKFQRSGKRHLLEKKNARRKRALGKVGFVSKSDRKRISRLIPS